jgi:formylmethanofuran dehydrogenase subunit E
MTEETQPKPTRQRGNRFATDINTVYVRCSQCGGKYDEKLVHVIADKIVCGMCKLITIVWKQ